MTRGCEATRLKWVDGKKVAGQEHVEGCKRYLLKEEGMRDEQSEKSKAIIAFLSCCYPCSTTGDFVYKMHCLIAQFSAPIRKHKHEHRLR